MDDRTIMYLGDGSILLVQGERRQSLNPGATNQDVDAAAAAFFTDGDGAD